MKNNHAPTSEVVPQHVAIIMDGNGRWAKRRGLPRMAGHRAGTENLRQILEACVEIGIKYLTIYAFSTENWERPTDEVSGLMGLFREMFEREMDSLNHNEVQLRHLGSLDRVDPNLRERVLRAVQTTSHNQRLILNVAFNYGGRDEIVRAVRHIVADGLPAESITEETITRYLYTAGLPDPDLIIRTSGELRISNFLIWQAAYSEWYFTDTFWPDFDEGELRKALAHFASRERRYGKISEQLPQHHAR